jgi:hypothetical protein
MIAYEYISTADNITLMRVAVDLSTPEGIADAVNLEGGTFVQSEDGDSWREMTEQELADIAEQKEQARLQQVATEYAVPLQQFADAWAETGVETVPESWDDAFVLLKQSGVSADVFCELLALRLGALAPVWDDVLIILNGGM